MFNKALDLDKLEHLGISIWNKSWQVLGKIFFSKGI